MTQLMAMNASRTGKKGALTSSRLGTTDASNLNGAGGVCVCVRVRVCACLIVCVRDVFAIIR